MCFTVSIPRRGSLPFAASSMVKLTEGWLPFSVDRNASAVSMLGIRSAFIMETTAVYLYAARLITVHFHMWH